MRNQSSQWLIPFLLAAGAAAALWYYWSEVNQPVPEQAAEAPVARESGEVPGPLHPVESVSDETESRPNLVPLPALDESDEYLKIEIVDIFGESVEGLLA